MDPTLLALPNIPKPMHGTAPREVLGALWWAEERSKALEQANGICKACGRKSNKLECHEVYDTRVDLRRLIYLRTEVLCSDCHKFIHSGLLWVMLIKKMMPEDEVVSILTHGLELCYKYNIIPFCTVRVVYYALPVSKRPAKYEYLIKNSWDHKHKVEWDGWKLIIDGIEYDPVIKTSNEWKAKYR